MKKFCIGIDIAKKTFDATAIFFESIDSLNEVGYRQFDNSTSGFRTLVSWAKKLCKQCNGKLSEDGLFCMETTGGYDRQICMYLHDKGQNVWRESALQIHRSSGFRRGKNDKADSRNISEYAAKHQDKLVLFSPDPTVIMELKEIVNYRATMVERRKEAKTRLSEKKFTTVLGKSQTARAINKMSESEIKTLDQIIEKCNQEIERIINSDEDLKRNYLHMTSINGVGLVNAACIIAYSSNFKKITTPNKMSCYAGAHTFYDESGTSVHKKDPSKIGVRAGMNPAPTLSPLILNCGELSPTLNPFEVVGVGAGFIPALTPLSVIIPPPCHLFLWRTGYFPWADIVTNLGTWVSQ